MADRGLLRALLPIAVMLAVGACGSDILGPEEVDFVDELQIDIAAMTRTESGLYIQDLTVGDGDIVTSGTVVTMDYAGWLPNGANFDSGVDATFAIGIDSLILGFTEGVIGMRVGGTRTMVLPSSLGYGDQPPAGIPRNSVLVFRVTLKSIP